MSKKKLLILFFVVVQIGWLGIGSQGQIMPPNATDSGLGGNNSITGMVMTSTGRRVERRVTIRLQTMTRGDRLTTTDESGNFAFRGLISGDYTIVIDKEKDFEPFSQMVTIIQVRGFPGQTYNLSLRLLPKASAQTKVGVVDAELAELPQRGQDLFNKAEELVKAGDHNGAIAQFQMLTTEFPGFMFGFNELGVEYMRLNECNKAMAPLQTAIKLEPDAFAPLMNYGIVLVYQKKYSEAEPILRHVMKIDDHSAGVHYFLGQALANLGKFDEGAKELVSAISMGGDEVKEAHRILAIIYSSRGDKNRAADELEAYLRLAPNAKDADDLRKVVQQLRGVPAAQSNSKPAQ